MAAGAMLDCGFGAGREDGAMTRSWRNLVISASAAALAAVAAVVIVVEHTPPSPPNVPPAAQAALGSGGDSGLVALESPRPVPPLAFVDGDNKPVTLADFHGAVLLNIWATWCVPCRKEMLTLDRLQQKLGGPDFHVVPLSIDREGTGVVDLFYQQLGIKSLGVYVDSSMRDATAIDVVGLPTTLLIDRNGRELARKVGGAEWDSPAMIAHIREILRSDGETLGAVK